MNSSNPLMIDKISGLPVEPIDVLDIRKLPLPEDNWYEPGELDSRPDWGCSAPTFFALIDDIANGESPCWFPIEFQE